MKMIDFIRNNTCYLILFICIMTGCNKKHESDISIPAEQEKSIEKINEDHVINTILDYEDEILDFETYEIVVSNDIYAVIKYDNTIIFSEPDINSNIVMYKHKGDIVKVERRSIKLNYKGIDGYLCNINYKNGWVHDSALEYIKVTKNNITTLTNSEDVNYKYFPNTPNSTFYPI